MDDAVTVRPERFDFATPEEGSTYFYERHIEIERQVQPTSILGRDEPWPDWLDLADWHHPPLLNRRRREIRIVLVARNPYRHGCLRRLIRGIVSEGSGPVVVCPVLEVMPALMRKWDWWMQLGPVGEEWRPRKGKLFGTPQTHDQLVADYDGWLRSQPEQITSLPDLLAEALLHANLTGEQRRWLSEFVLRWQEADHA